MTLTLNGARFAGRDLLPKAIIGAAIFLVGVVGVCTSICVYRERAVTIDKALRKAGSLSAAIEEQTSRTFDSLDLTLKGMVHTLRFRSVSDEHDVAFEQALRQKARAQPYVRSLYIVGSDGYVQHESNHHAMPRLSVSDRDYFKVHAENPNAGLHIGRPLMSRTSNSWFVAVSRRISHPDGSFAGVAVVSLEPEYFAQLYSSLNTDKDNRISLFLRDGTLLWRQHEDGGATLGKSFARLPLFQRTTESPSGTLVAPSGFDGVRRLMGYAAAPAYPVIVTVGVSEEAALAAWRKSAKMAYSAFAITAAAIFLMAWQFLRYRKKFERTREAHLQAQRLQTLGKMAGGIAHDFRNLLMVVSASLSLVRGAASDRAKVERLADTAADAVREGAALTDQLLAFARQQELELRVVDIHAQLRKLEPLLRQAAPLISIDVKLEARAVNCTLDATQFDSALLNLVVNARDASAAGGLVVIRTQDHRHDGHTRYRAPAGDYVSVSVTDQGTGMPPELLDRALDPFFTTKGENGTGLGLSQVHGFVQQIGGDIQIESAVGAGTTVYLLFPHAKVHGRAATPSWSLLRRFLPGRA